MSSSIKNNLLFLSLFILTCSTAQAQNYGWGYQAGSDTWDAVQSTHLGDDNNLLVTGMFQNTADFGGTNISNYDFQDGFIAKYDGLGNVLWANAINGYAGQVWGMDVTTDANNNVYVTGYFQSSAIYFTATDSIEITPGIARDVYLVKYNSSGVYQWARTGTGEFATGRTVVCDSQNNVIIGGSYNDVITFSGTASSTATTGIYLVKYDDLGNLIWVKDGTSISSCWFADLDVDASDNIYATGKISANTVFGSTSILNIGGDDMVIGKFNSSGDLQWMEVLGNSISAITTAYELDSGNGIVLDQTGNIFVGGSFIDTTYWNGTVVTYQFATVMKYDNNGTQQWLNQYGNHENDVINDIALDSNGDPYVIGNYSEDLTIGAFPLPTQTGIRRAFMAKFDKSTGSALWATEHGTSTDDNTGMGLQIQPTSGEILSVGNFGGACSFGLNSLTSLGSNDIYLILSNDIAGIENEISNDQLLMYPNPTNGAMHISLPSEASDTGEIFIYSLNGQVVFQQKLYGQENDLDVSELVAGSYLMVVKTDQGEYHDKIVKY